ncbi:MAG: hypothetical protein LBB40_03215 [Holophagales bacterium]|jgi:hypothetical protein|nr:hypothetical protein [Holophagales bacterium]
MHPIVQNFIALNNQVLWIERPAILDILETHPDCTTNLKQRITGSRKDVLGQLSVTLAEERLEIIDDVESGTLDKAWAKSPLPMENKEKGKTVDTELTDSNTQTVSSKAVTEAGPRSVSQRITDKKIVGWS